MSFPNESAWENHTRAGLYKTMQLLRWGECRDCRLTFHKWTVLVHLFRITCTQDTGNMRHVLGRRELLPSPELGLTDILQKKSLALSPVLLGDPFLAC